MRPARVGVLIVAVAAMLSGCATTAPAAPAPSSSAAAPTPHTSAHPASSPAIDLVGLWRVSGAAGETADTWLRLGGDLILWRPCGMISGSWTAADGAFLADVNGGSMTCIRSEADMHVPWLAASASYRRTSAGWQLLDAAGAPTATLAVAGAPKPDPNADPSLVDPPQIDTRLRAFLGDPAPIPAVLAPARSGELVGRWIPAGDRFATDPHVVFGTDGRWDASDGCNGVTGRWVMPSAGRVLITGGASTDMGCDGAPVPTWVAATARVALDGEALVLLDRGGAELGRLVRA